MGEPPVLASDAEREATMERLREAAGAGRLTLEELADRLGAASEARSREQLAQLTCDLPPEHDLAHAHVVAAPEHVASVFGDVQRHGRWVVPARSRWRSVFGDVVLDLRDAHVPASAVTIDASSVFGDIDLLVPEGVVVEVRSRSTFGNVEQDAGQSGAFGAPHVVLTGGTVFGDVRVRARRLREALLARVLGGRLLSR